MNANFGDKQMMFVLKVHNLKLKRKKKIILKIDETGFIGKIIVCH